MKTRLASFNLYLWALALFLVTGCNLGGLDPKKEYTSLHVFLEARNGAKTGAQLVKVVGTPMYIESEPILTEADLNSAKIIDYPDGTYAIQLTFNDHGMIELDMTTGSSKRLNLVIYALFPPKGFKEPKDSDDDNTATANANSSTNKIPAGQARVSSWSATPIRSVISNGVLTFTPDASHAEAERIVRGLKNMVKAINKMN
jgi:hypothetical protein